MSIWAIWKNMRVPRWSIQMAIWSHLDAIWSHLDAIWSHLDPSGAIWTLHLGTRMELHLDIWLPL